MNHKKPEDIKHPVNSQNMKTLTRSVFFLAILSLLFTSSCNQSKEDKIAGAWRVENVEFDDPQGLLDPVMVQSIIKNQKSILYELYQDRSMKVRTGSSVIEGTWMFNKEDDGVYVMFADNLENTQLGIFSDGKIVNEDFEDSLTIRTTFIKERKLK